MICPNKNTQEWRELVSRHGEEGAYQVFFENNFGVPEIFASPLEEAIAEEDPFEGMAVDPDAPPPVSPESSKLLNNINSFITNLEIRLNRVKDLAFNEKDKLKQDRLKERVRVLTEQIDKLKSTHQAADLIAIAREHLYHVQGQLSQPSLTLKDFEEAYKYLNTYSNFIDSLLHSSDKEWIEDVNDEGEVIKVKKEVYTQAEEIETLYKRVFDEYQKINFQIIGKELPKDLGIDATIEDILGAVKDTGFVQANIRTAAMQSNKILSWINSIRLFAVRKADREINSLKTQENKLLADLKNSALFKALGWKMFIQQGSDRSLVNRYSSKYWKENSDFYAGLKSGKSALIKKALEWYNKNMTVIDLNRFIVDEGDIDEDLKNEYKKELIVEFGKERGTRLLEEAISKFKIYQDHRSAKIAEVDEIPDISQEAKSMLMDDWILENSPILAAKRLQEGGYNKLHGGGNPEYSYYEYFTARPKDTNGNYDEMFKRIEADPAAKAYHEFVSKTLSDNFKLLPQSFIANNKISSGLLPYVQRTAKEAMVADGMTSLYHGAVKWGINKIATKKESTVVSTEVNKTTGEFNRSLPIRLFNAPTRFNEKTGEQEVDQSELSMDLSHIMQETIQSYVIYKHKSLVEDKLLFARRALNNVQEDLEKTRFQSGEPLTSSQGLKNLKVMADFAVDVFYDQKNKKEGTAAKSTALTRTIKENEEYQAVERAIANKQEELLTAEPLKKLAIQEEIKRLTEIRDKIGKGISFSQTLRSMMTYLALKTQAFNILGPTVELIGGNINLLSHAASGLDYDMSHHGVSSKLIYGLNKKTKNVLRAFNIVKSHVELEEGVLSKAESALTYLNAQTDIKLRGTNAISVMLATKLDPADLKSGESASFYEILDENGNPDPALFTEEGWAKWNPESGEINNFYQLDLKIRTLNDRIFGAYDPDNPLMMKRHAAGAAIMQFKTFIVEGWFSRWEGEKESPELGRKVKGRYWSYGDLYKTRGASGTALALLQGMIFSKKAFEGLSPIDQANMKKNIIELYALMAVYATAQVLALTLAGDDDEEDDYLALNLLLNSTLRIQTDLMYYINPNEAKSLNERAIPLFQLYSDATGIKDATVKILEGNYEVQQGSFKGMNVFLKETAELFPVSAAGLKLYKQMHEIIKK